VLVVAVRRDHRDEALLELLAQLAAAGLAAMVVTALVGERLARFALLPVERYRAQADDISAGASGIRLEVPSERDDEVTRLGHTLNRMLDQLEEALERERHFVNDASHELRTPLTLLSTRVQLARRRTRSVAEHEGVLAEIQTDIVRLAALADHLLVLGHHTGLEPGAAGADLAAVAERETERRNALDRALGRAGAGHAVRTVEAHGPVPVRLPDEAVGQVIGNLLDNAAKHGAPPVRVVVDRIGTAGGDDVARLVVSDHGPGMDAELLATATRRFTRSADSRSREGFGLGLSLVEGIVTRAGGELRLCSRGRHHRQGTAYDVPCTHPDTMSVTVLLPLS
jgi:signal transduction histidine kinase